MKKNSKNIFKYHKAIEKKFSDYEEIVYSKSKNTLYFTIDNYTIESNKVLIDFAIKNKVQINMLKNVENKFYFEMRAI